MFFLLNINKCSRKIIEDFGCNYLENNDSMLCSFLPVEERGILLDHVKILSHSMSYFRMKCMQRTWGEIQWPMRKSLFIM